MSVAFLHIAQPRPSPAPPPASPRVNISPPTTNGRYLSGPDWRVQEGLCPPRRRLRFADVFQLARQSLSRAGSPLARPQSAADASLEGANLSGYNGRQVAPGGGKEVEDGRDGVGGVGS